MGLIRLLVFGFAIWLLYRFFTAGKRRLTESRKLKSGAMVKCLYCDTHVPKDGAIDDDGLWFCSPEHRNNYRNKS